MHYPFAKKLNRQSIEANPLAFGSPCQCAVQALGYSKVEFAGKSFQGFGDGVPVFEAALQGELKAYAGLADGGFYCRTIAMCAGRRKVGKLGIIAATFVFR